MRDHKSLKAWQEGRSISIQALRIAKRYWVAYATEVFRQLQRSALSIQLNIAEGHALGDRGRFANHLAIAYGSAVESTDLLELMVDEDLIPRAVGEQALTTTRLCERLLLGLLKRYRKKPDR
jgi:four helix bundle protein